MKKLTQSEEQIMQALWSLDQGGYIKDILEALDAPKPHHNTVEKEFVGIQNPNRNNFYHPLVSKSAYSGKRIEGLTENYFEGSYANVVSFLVDKKQISIEDLELLLQQLKNKRND
jgi:BlaI family penicillinase repressor